MVIGTICAANHLSKAACLAKSLRETQPRHIFALCLLERDKSALDGLEAWFPEVILASETGITDFSSFIFRYERYEACCAVKARFLLWLMNRFPQEQNFLFLHPDVMAYSRFEELEALLPESEIFTRAQIIVTPHQLRDEDSSLGVRENTFRTLTAGTFNLGFLALRRSPTSVEFLEWWDNKLQNFCYMEWQERGLFVDQKWALLGLSFFDMTVLREPGYNVAHWNVSTRRITREGENRYSVNGRPLRFFHFSNTDSDRDLYYLRRFLDTSNPVFTLRDKYKEEIHSFGHRELSQLPWSYDRFLSGAPIGPEARFVYRNNPQLWPAISNPFAESVARFYSLSGPNGSPNESSRKQRNSYSRFRNFLTRSFT
jgi:hypothetical protein